MISIKKVAAICKRAGHVRLHTTERGQWLGTAKAMYDMSGMPEMDGENVFAVLEFTDKQKINAVVESDYRNSFAQYEEFPVTDLDAPQQSPVMIGAFGADFAVFLFGKAVMLVDTEYLKPVKCKDMPTLHVRHDEDGQAVIAVMEGCVLRAVLWPDLWAEREIAPAVRALAAKMSAAARDTAEDGQEAMDL